MVRVFQLSSRMDWKDTSVRVNTTSNPSRVQVSVTADYKPLINLIPIPERDIMPRSAPGRSLAIGCELRNIFGLGRRTRRSVPTSTTAPNTAVPTDHAHGNVPVNTPTATVLFATNTVAPTATLPPGVPTFTPILQALHLRSLPRRR